MISLIPSILLFLFFLFLFVREIELDKKRFRETKRLANDHVLRDVERFLTEKALEKLN